MNLFWSFRPFNENQKSKTKTVKQSETLNPYSFKHMDEASLSFQGREGQHTHQREGALNVGSKYVH